MNEEGSARAETKQIERPGGEKDVSTDLVAGDGVTALNDKDIQQQQWQEIL